MGVVWGTSPQPLFTIVSTGIPNGYDTGRGPIEGGWGHILGEKYRGCREKVPPHASDIYSRMHLISILKCISLPYTYSYRFLIVFLILSKYNKYYRITYSYYRISSVQYSYMLLLYISIRYSI